MSLFGCIKVAEAFPSFVDVDIGLPFANALVKAGPSQAAGVTLVERFVLHLLRHRRWSQIRRLVSGFVSIFMVDAIRWPFAGHERPDNAVSENETRPNPYSEITPVGAARCFAAKPPVQPNKPPCIVDAKAFAKFGDWNVGIARMHETLYNVLLGRAT